MSLLWVPVRPPRDVEAAKATMEALGGQLRSPIGVTHYWVDPETNQLVKHIGYITVGGVTGQIMVWPHVDIDDRDLAYLLGMAENAFTTRPTKATGYQLRRKGRRTHWRCGVVIRARGKSAADQQVLSVVAALPFNIDKYLESDFVNHGDA